MFHFLRNLRLKVINRISLIKRLQVFKERLILTRKKFKLYWLWIKKLRYMVYIVIGIVGSFLLAGLFSVELSKQLEISGFVLSFLGTFIIIVEVLRMRNAYNLPTIKELIKNLISSFPLFQKIVQKSNHDAISVNFNVEGAVDDEIKPSSSISLEEKFAALEEYVNRLNTRINNSTKSLVEQISSINKNITLKEEENNKKFEMIKQIITDLAVGNINWQVTGLVWMIIGLLFGAIAIFI